MEGSPEQKAIRHLSQIRFHQQFTLEANPSSGRPDPIRVTYADCNYLQHETPSNTENPTFRANVDNGPVLLFIGGMFGTRYMSTGSIDSLARKHRLRVIVPDRFGFGGTGNVPLEWRVKGFIDLVRGLLTHLGIKHVSMASHSAGTIYILNAVLELRHLLHPKYPYVCLLAPWVHPSHSGKLQSLSIVPDALLSQWNKIAKVIGSGIGSIESSGVGLASYSRSLRSSFQSPKQATESLIDADYDDTLDYDPQEGTVGAVESLVRTCMFAENTTGGVEEAFLCLKRGPKATWGCFENFDEAIPKIFEVEAASSTERVAQHEAHEPGMPGSTTASDRRDLEGKLRVQLYFAETDSFIGKKGQEWMDNLWRQFSEHHQSITFDSKIVPSSGHNTIFDVRFGVVDELFATVRVLWTGGQAEDVPPAQSFDQI